MAAAAVIANSIAGMIPSPGIPFYGPNAGSAWQKLNTTLPAAATTTTTFTLPVGVTKGRFRIRLFGAVNTPSVVLRAFFSDGTDKVNVVLPLAAFTPDDQTAGQSGIDIIQEFILEITATSFVVIVTLAGAAGTYQMDLEVFGQQ